MFEDCMLRKNEDGKVDPISINHRDKRVGECVCSN